MTSTTATKLPNNNYNTIDSGSAKLGAHDLQLLLRPRLGNQLVVLKAHVSSLLPPGENFACSIFKVDTTVKRADNEPEETLHLIAKTFPLARNMLEIFDYSKLFKKEIFFYEKIAKMYNELEREFGVQDLLDIAPKLYGAGSTSTKGAEKNKVDESVVILMENLKSNGYYTLDKIEGLDLNHSRLAIRDLARFHALGIACKHHRPSFFASEVLRHAQVVPFHERESIGNIFDLMYKKLMRDPRIAAYGERIHSLLNPERRRIFFEYLAPEPWVSVTHFDFWTNNILYHKDEEGHLDGIKFIDFQNYAYNSPLRDIPYFLCTSTKREVMMEHFEELLDLYYETFIGTLKRMKINTEKFGRESFDEQLKTDAAFEFFHNVLAIKFFCAEIDKNTYDQSQIETVVICSDVNQMGYDKWYDIVMVYLKKDWL